MKNIVSYIIIFLVALVVFAAIMSGIYITLEVTKFAYVITGSRWATGILSALVAFACLWLAYIIIDGAESILSYNNTRNLKYGTKNKN